MSKPESSLVIGYGSIGRRHEEVLRGLGVRTAIVSRHASDAPSPCFRSVQEGLDSFDPKYIVVANRTSEHLNTLDEIDQLGFSGICLVEKPLATHSISDSCTYGFEVSVGYVLRFHPLLQKAVEILEGHRLISIQAYVGQYLPDWRPGSDYRQCYSARRDQGGGALRDLSHELDYLSLLAGPWVKVAAKGGHLSGLEIDTDDAFGLLIELERCPIVLCQMNYLDRNLRRDCSIQYDGGSLHLDFINCQLTHNGQVERVEIHRNDMFKAMHAAAWDAERNTLCSLNEANHTLELIDAAEKSVKGDEWICRANQ